MFRDPDKTLIICLIYNELHQCEPYKNLSLVLTYKKLTKKKRSFSNFRLNIAS